MKETIDNNQKIIDNWLKTVGVGVSLSEYKKELDNKDHKYVEFTNVKSFKIPKGNGYGNNDLIRNDKKIHTILVLSKGMWCPRNSDGCSGCSGVGKNKKPFWNANYSLSNHRLTHKEIMGVIKKINSETLRPKLAKWYTYENGKKVRTKDKFYDLECRSDADRNDVSECLRLLREIGEEKISKRNRTNLNTFYINDVLFQYTSEVKETLGSYQESLSYGYYFYDKDGNYIDSLNYGALYG